MKFTKKFFCLNLIISLFLLTGCTKTPVSQPVKDTPAAHRTVMLSLYNDNNPWPIALARDISSSAEKNGIELILKNAKGSAEQQYADISGLREGDVDMVLLSAIDMEVGAKCIEHCNEQNLPVMLVSRNSDAFLGSDCVTFMGCDYELVGYTQGLALVRLFGDDTPCNIVELAGEPDASTTNSLASGFRRAIRRNSNMQIVSTQNASSATREALDAMENIIQSGVEFQAVFCHSDADALGAIQALKTAGLTPGTDPSNGEIIITSNCGYDDAIKAVIIGELYSTIDINARLGDLVVETMQDYWNNSHVMSRIKITYKEITQANALEWIGKGY